MNNAEMTPADIAKVATLESEVASLKGWKLEHDRQCRGTNKRLTRIELAMATALGGMIVLGWFVNRLADNIISMIARIQ